MQNNTLFRRTAARIFVAGMCITSIAATGAGFSIPSCDGPCILVRGAQIQSANGIYFDSQDRLAVASTLGQNISLLDPESGVILKRFGAESGVIMPDDLVFAPNGSFYWTDFGTGEVGLRTPDGMVKKQFVGIGVNAITLSREGRLFVALDFLGAGLYELDPNLVAAPRLVIPGPALGWLNGMDFGPDGYLYGPLWAQKQIVRINVDTGELTLVAAGFLQPTAVKFNSKGMLYTTDQWSGDVYRVNIATGSRKSVTVLPIGADNLAFDSRDRLYVSNHYSGAIFRVFPESGAYRVVSKGGMIFPGGVAVAPQEQGVPSLFVADMYTLREFNAVSGEPRSVDLSTGFTGYPGMVGPQTVAAAGDGVFILSTWLFNTVQAWNHPTGEVAYTLPFDPATTVIINAIPFGEELVIAKIDFNAPDRVVLAQVDDPAHPVYTPLAGMLEGIYVPAGLAATGDDLYVSDNATGTLWQLYADGTRLTPPLPIATGLSQPEGLAISADGMLLVVEAGAGRLTRVNPVSGETAVLVSGLEISNEPFPIGPPTGILSSVATGQCGLTFVSSYEKNVIYRFIVR